MARIDTEFTRLLSLKTPIALASMTFVSGGLLAAEVTRAGGFGFLAIEFRFGIERFQADFALARERLGTPEGEVLPIGVGVIGWMLDAPIGVKEMLKWAIMQGVKAVWLSFGEDIGKWVQFVREADEERGDGRKTLVAVQLGTVQQMKVAAEEWKVDIIVAQGSEAGGHSWAAASSTATLGGVSSGAHIASYLALGASGVVVGTLFAGTEESVYDPFSKDVILKAGYDDAVRTTLWDRVQTYPWPKGIDGRAICQQLRDDDAAGLGIDQIREKIKEDAKEGNRSREIVWAGYPAAYIKQIRPAKDVVEQLHRETVECLRLGTTLVKTD